ncbi:MAG: hypothetical protein ABSG44_00260 [Thermodesulfobacteriota bacterium]|jgi:hypothetical protein
MKLFMKFFIVLNLFFIFNGLVTISRARAEGELIVHFVYAPEKIRQGDIWKVYLSVTDPEGRMQQVACRVEQQGESYHKPSLIFLKKGMERQFTGHFAVHTHSFYELNDFVLALNILDRDGNVRKTLHFPLEFDQSSEPMKPLPPDMEKDLNRRVGIIDIDWDLGRAVPRGQ